MLDELLEIFKHAFHKLSLVGVKNLGKRTSDDGRRYYRFIGRFEFEPPAQLFQDELEENKLFLLQKFRSMNEESSNCFKRKFTKKLFLNGKVENKVDFQYVFDVIPKNIIDFEINKESGKMYLHVLGYGTF